MAYIDKCGVEFSDDRKTLVKCPQNFQGEYKIPDDVLTIRKEAFSYCAGMTSIFIGNNVTSIGNGAFYACINLISVTLPRSLRDIGESAFSNCASLKSIIIPNSVKIIGKAAFEACSNMSSIAIPDSIINIGEAAFSGCSNLTIITVAVQNQIYDSRDNCNAIIETANHTFIKGCKNSIIPHNIKSIGNFAFSGCFDLTSVFIPHSVTSIGENAFSGCRDLKSIILPNSVTSIGDLAFAFCHSLNSVTICNSVASIADHAFLGCDSLNEINVPTGEEERFCEMRCLKDFKDIIQSTFNKNEERPQQREDIEQKRLQAQQLQEILQDAILFFDTETTGVPKLYNASVTNSANWPRLVQLAWIMADKNGNVLKRKSVIIKPDGFIIPHDASAVHGITTERAQREGQPLDTVMEEFINDVQLAASVVGHNIDFDMHIVGAELYRLDMDYDLLMDKPCTCTMKSSTDFCAIPNPNTYLGGYKWPSLQELYRKLFGHEFTGAHDALTDVTATKECYFELKRRGVI